CVSKVAKERMGLFLETGGQTREGELDIFKVVDEYTRKLEEK
ncbi:unnamed protein product, partial [marine sediment metagenome]